MAATYDYAIVGNSAAAINACEAIRGVDREGSIILFGEEKYRCYSRPLISYLVAGQIESRGMYYRPSGFYRSMGVEFRKGTRVEEVHAARKTLTTDGKEKVKWRRLLLATGFKPFIPPVPGLEEIDYLTFVSWDDARRMLARTARPARVLIVGAGLIGMKAAEAARARGAAVTVVEKMERVLPQALDAEASRMVWERCREAGIDIVTGQGVAELESRGNGKGRAVLEDGGEMDFDLLVMAVGVRPRVELAEGAGLDCSRGIEVDGHQRTSLEGVYAAGDAVNAMDVVLGRPSINALWPVAALQGKYAGLNMAGKEVPYPGCNSMNAVEFFGLPVLSAGIVNPPDDGYEVISRRSDAGDYRKVVLRGEVLVGMLVAGRIERAGILTSLIQERANVRRVKNFLLEEAFGHIHLPRSVRQERITETAAGIMKAEAARDKGV
ncbi:MAG: NAD(P)/FAD-dependent oxidoreductase [Actinobacteria bacterium]|nr:NAD(P)/FAD-dependent oxidoreductase [Actinomycetota bacterium]MDI6830584.1 FAD-dependent oxidoreductase [Actinomycetota bacterium]